MFFLKIGVCLRHKEGLLRESFEKYAKVGFEDAQFISWLPERWTKEEREEILSLSKEFNMHLTSFWCGWSGERVWNFTEGPKTIGIVPDEYREVRTEELIKGGDFAASLGLQNVITHMGFLPEDPNDPKFEKTVNAIRKIALHLKDNGQNLLFETGQETPVTLLRTIEAVGTGNLYINLDPSNLILYGKANPVDALDVFGKYVKEVHAKDGLYPTEGVNLGKEVPIGEGKVNFPLLIPKLKTFGFDGYLCIEREIKGEQQIIDIKNAVSFLQNII